MTKFVPERKSRIGRVHNDTVSVKLPDDIRHQFHELCERTGLSPNKLGGQMFRFALSHMDDEK